MENEETISYFDPRVCIIGSSKHSRPLAKLFSTKYRTRSFNLDKRNNIETIRNCNFYIAVVTTPKELQYTSEIVGSVISNGDIVIFESTLLPTVTKDQCIPIIEKLSGLYYNLQFFVCIREFTADKILKPSLGCSPEVCKIVDEIYSTVINKNIVDNYNEEYSILADHN